MLNSLVGSGEGGGGVRISAVDYGSLSLSLSLASAQIRCVDGADVNKAVWIAKLH